MKFSELPTKTDRAGCELKVENAVIQSVRLSTEDHALLSGYLDLAIGSSSGCSFGGYKLGNAGGGNLTKTGGDYAAEWITRCIAVVYGEEYGAWEGMKGKPIRVLSEGLGGSVIAIGHFLKDSWFCPRIEFEEKQPQPTS